MKSKRLAAAVLACLLLVSCGPTQMEPVAEEPTADGEAIAYVPLDDRPDNAERVVYLANSLGYQLVMPEEDWYQTKLDDQPLNENGTQSGDRARLYEWVLEQESHGCDRYILFLDQLLSGGLVNSRHISGENPVALSDGSVLTEAELLEQLLVTLAADRNNRVWLLDTVMRLAPTCGYDGFGIDEYNHLREYAMQPRPVLTGSELTVQNILTDYRLASDGMPLVPGEYALTENLVTEYLSARERKLRLSEETQQLLARSGYENFRLLIGIDDSSAEDSIQKNEIALLRQNLRTDDAVRLDPCYSGLSKLGCRDWILSGVDDLAFKAVTRLYLDECEEQDPSLAEMDLNDVYIRYAGGTEDQPACAYDSQPLETIVEEHLEFFGLERVSVPQNADLQLLVLTQPKPEAAEMDGWPHGYWEGFVEELRDYADLPTILIDASNNQYGTAFHDALAEKCVLGQLMSYSGFLDMAIVTGTALSHGVARYAWLVQGNGTDEAATRAYQKGLAEAILLDFCYRNTVRDDLSAYVRELGGDPNNFYAPAIDTEAVRKKLEEGMAQSTKAVLKNLSRSNLIVSLEEYQAGEGGMAGWGDICLSNWRFPWQRVFEVRMDIQLGALTEPHKHIFGVYYQ